MSSARLERPARGRRWYAVKTIARKEALAQLHLGRQDFESFCPRIMAPPVKARRGRHVPSALAPFFPGYVFVHLDLANDPWRSVNGTIGVCNLVQFGNYPAALPPGLMEQLRAMTDAGGRLALPTEVEPGQSVRVTGGPFDGWIGKVLRVESRERVSILLDLMAREMPVVIGRDQLMALG